MLLLGSEVLQDDGSHHLELLYLEDSPKCVIFILFHDLEEHTISFGSENENSM